MPQTAKYAYWGVNNPNFAIQIYSGNYIVSDYGNNRIIELTSTLSAIVRSYSINGCVFFDYSEENETLLITSETLNQIIEISWSELDYGTTVWQSSISLSSPQCATYRQNNINEILIADTSNNRIVLCDKAENTYRALSYYKLSEDDTSITHVIVRGIFENPMEAGRFVNHTTNLPYMTIDSPYTIPNNMLNSLKKMILEKELNIIVTTPSDLKNDSIHGVDQNLEHKFNT